MTQKQITKLFGTAKSTIGEHLKNIFLSSELEEEAVVRNFRTTANDGKHYNVKYYNIDNIISVGYRVNSVQATQFRIWATKIMNQILIK